MPPPAQPFRVIGVCALRPEPSSVLSPEYWRLLITFFSRICGPPALRIRDEGVAGPPNQRLCVRRWDTRTAILSVCVQSADFLSLVG